MHPAEAVEFLTEPRPGRVSIVVVCYDSLDELRSLLPTIDEQSYPDIEVVFVLNDADDDTAEYLSGREGTVVVPDENRWYSGGNDLGAEHSTGEYVLILNPDVELHEDAVRHLVDAAERRPSSAALVPKVLDRERGERTNIVESIGKQFTRGGWATNVGAGDGAGAWTEPNRVAGFDGPAVLVRREAIEAVGLFDRRFGFRREATDLALRFYQSGWEVTTVPESLVWHEGQTSTSETARSRLDFYYGTRNGLFLSGKNFAGVVLPFFLLNYVRVHLLQATSLLRSGEFGMARAKLTGFLVGAYWFFRSLRRDERLGCTEQVRLFRDLPTEIDD